MEETGKDIARQLLADMGAVASKFNRKAGIDTGLNRVRLLERMHVGEAMFRRLVSQKDATVRDFLEAASRRFADLKRTVDDAEREKPSIPRFERVIRAMGQVILEAAQSQDCLFELSGAFRRGFDLLAERPKQPDAVSSADDLFFNARERTRIVKAILAFYEIIVSCGHDCYAMPSLIAEQPLPERIRLIIEKHRTDRTKPVTGKVRMAMIADTHFILAKDGLWSYDGSFFRYLKRYFGACNTDNIDPEMLLDECPGPFLDLPLGELIFSDAGQALGLSIVSAMATGDGTPEMAAARASDVSEEIRNAVLRDKLREAASPISGLRKKIAENLADARTLRAQLESDEWKACVREAEDPQAAEQKRQSSLKQIDDNIRQMEEASATLDGLEKSNGEAMEDVAPRIDPSSFMPKPALSNEGPKVYSKYRGKTLRRNKSEWIRIEKDGVTFTCPTRMGSEIRNRSYTMPNSPQIDFMDELLAHFESGEWYKPDENKSVWQNTCFNRGDAKQFHDDRHIALWTGEKGGMRGGIRLAIP